jgi:hypothetical protein
MGMIVSVRDMAPTGRRTPGALLTEVTFAAATTGFGFLVAIIGSIGPWVSSPYDSASGMHGAGKLTIALAIIGLLVVTFDKAPAFVPMIGLVLAVLGGWEWYHTRSASPNAVLLGVHVGSVGWGVYAVIGGGVIAFLTAQKTWR